jgi:hypothetical protein
LTSRDPYLTILTVISENHENIVPLVRFSTEGVVATSHLGKNVFAALVSSVRACTVARLFFLDFEGVQIATTSFLRESVLAFRNYARSSLPNLYPVVANMSPAVHEELLGFLAERGDVMVSCRYQDSDATESEAVGFLDRKQSATLRAVVLAGESDAGELTRQFAETERIGATAWNNRLAYLAGKGLLIATSAGRTKRYRPIIAGLKYGS